MGSPYESYMDIDGPSYHEDYSPLPAATGDPQHTQPYNNAVHPIYQLLNPPKLNIGQQRGHTLMDIDSPLHYEHHSPLPAVTRGTKRPHPDNDATHPIYQQPASSQLSFGQQRGHSLRNRALLVTSLHRQTNKNGLLRHCSSPASRAAASAAFFRGPKTLPRPVRPVTPPPVQEEQPGREIALGWFVSPKFLAYAMEFAHSFLAWLTAALRRQQDDTIVVVEEVIALQTTPTSNKRRAISREHSPIGVQADIPPVVAAEEVHKAVTPPKPARIAAGCPPEIVWSSPAALDRALAELAAIEVEYPEEDCTITPIPAALSSEKVLKPESTAKSPKSRSGSKPATCKPTKAVVYKTPTPPKRKSALPEHIVAAHVDQITENREKEEQEQWDVYRRTEEIRYLVIRAKSLNIDTTVIDAVRSNPRLVGSLRVAIKIREADLQLEQAAAQAAEEEAKAQEEQALRLVEEEAKAREEHARKLAEEEAKTKEEHACKLAKEEAEREAEIARQQALNQRPLIQPLSQEWNDRVDQVMRTTNEKKILAAANSVELTIKDFNRLLAPNKQGISDQWLNDEVINGFFTAAVTRELEKLNYKKRDTPPVAVYNTTWVKTAERKGVEGLSGWSRRKHMDGEKLLTMRKVLMPIGTGAHWLIMVISPLARTIEVLDSMPDGGALRERDALRKGDAKYYRIAREWLAMELKARYVASEWTDMPTHSSEQNNCNDCGVFTCFNGLAAIRDMDYNIIKQEDMQAGRRMMAAVLLNGGMTGEFDL